MSKGKGGGAENWKKRGEWGSSNGGHASDGERKGGCPLSLLVLPFFVIGMLVRVVAGELIWTGGKKAGVCDAYMKSASKTGVLTVAVLALAAVTVVKL